MFALIHQYHGNEAKIKKKEKREKIVSRVRSLFLHTPRWVHSFFPLYFLFSFLLIICILVSEWYFSFFIYPPLFWRGRFLSTQWVVRDEEVVSRGYLSRTSRCPDTICIHLALVHFWAVPRYFAWPFQKSHR